MSGTGLGVLGQSLNSMGVKGFSIAGDVGVMGLANSSTGTGVLGQTPSTSGITYGVHGTAASVNGTGVWGEHTATTGTNAGVLGETASTLAYAAGVVGRVTSTSPGGYSAGVRGVNEGTGFLGIGVYGSQNGQGWGVFGDSASGYGVVAHSGATNAIWADGSIKADKLVYSSPRTHYLSVPGDVFRPQSISSSVGFRSLTGGGGAYFTAGSETTVVAPLNLPDGAVITSFHFYFYDNSSQSLTAEIDRYNPALGGSYFNVTASSSIGFTGDGDQTVYPSGSESVIQNNGLFYLIIVYSNGTWSSAGINLRVKGFTDRLHRR